MATEEQLKYKKVLEKLKSKNSKYKKNYMEFQDGDNNIRIVPGHPNMDGFYVEVMFHSKGNKKDRVKVICLNGEDGTKGDTCEICPEIKELLNSKDKKDQQMGRDQQGKSRYFFNVLDRDDDDQQKTVECGPQLLTEILTLLASDDYADLLDVNEGVDLIVKKSGKDLNTEYKVVPKRRPSPLFEDPKKIKAFIGKDAEDTKIVDLTDLLSQFGGEPEKAKLVWDEGWAALKDAAKDEDDEDEDEKPAKSTSKAPEKAPAKKPKVVEPEPDEDESEEDEVDVTKFPKLKSRCSVCGLNRYKSPSGNVCVNGHGDAPPLEEGKRPSKPAKEYLKEFPEPVDEEEEVEEEEEETPKTKTKAKTTPKKPVADDDDDDLDSLDEILEKHKKGKTK